MERKMKPYLCFCDHKEEKKGNKEGGEKEKKEGREKELRERKEKAKGRKRGGVPR